MSFVRGPLQCLLPFKLHLSRCRCRTFKEIASTEGSKSMEKKKGLIQKLVVGSRNNETGYIMRALQVQCGTGHLHMSSYLQGTILQTRLEDCSSMESTGAVADAGEAQDWVGRADSSGSAGTGSAAAQAGRQGQ